MVSYAHRVGAEIVAEGIATRYAPASRVPGISVLSRFMISALLGPLLRMPPWVQTWTFLILIPANMASLFFLSEPYALPVFLIANAATVTSPTSGSCLR